MTATVVALADAVRADPDVLRVAFRASCPVAMTHRPMQHDILWGDQSKPPPPVADRYTDPDRDPWVVWPPRGRAEGAQAARIKQTLFMLDPERVRLDPARCRFTYRRLTLAGVIVLHDDTWSRRARWTGTRTRPHEALDAAETILLAMRCALATVYEVGRLGAIDEIPMPGLSLSLREGIG